MCCNSAVLTSLFVPRVLQVLVGLVMAVIALLHYPSVGAGSQRGKWENGPVPLLESNGHPTNAQSGERTVEHVERCGVEERIN